MHNRTSDTVRFTALDSWRGIAALFVAIYHFPFWNHVYGLSLVRNSYLFVDFFFVLSGFVIAHAYQARIRDKTTLLAFCLRRFGRIYPLHLFTLLALVALELSKLYLANTGSWTEGVTAFQGRYSLSSFVSNLGLVHGFGIDGDLTWNYPSWSISTEGWAYVLFGLLCLVSIGRLRLASILIAVCWSVLFLNAETMNTYLNYAMFRCVLGFYIGNVGYLVFGRFRDSYRGGIDAEIVVVAAAACFIAFLGSTKWSLLAPLVFVTPVLVFAREEGFLSKVLLRQPLRKLGDISYSIYMIHAVFLAFLLKLFGVVERAFGIDLRSRDALPDAGESYAAGLLSYSGQYVMDVILVLYLLLVIGISLLTYKYVEVPGRNWFNEWAKRITASSPKDVPLTQSQLSRGP